MIKEFIPYNLALALKELGFDEPCFKKYIAGCLWSNPIAPEVYENIPLNSSDCLAPLYQQAFRWFREKYNLDGSMSVDVWNKKKVSYRITGGIENVIEADSYGSLYDIDSKEFLTYEEAELVCLEKLIEIVKNK